MRGVGGGWGVEGVKCSTVILQVLYPVALDKVLFFCQNMLIFLFLHKNMFVLWDVGRDVRSTSQRCIDWLQSPVTKYLFL